MVMAPPTDRLGMMLLREELITREQLDRALAESSAGGVRLGFSLVRLGFVEEAELARMLARQHRVPAVDLENARLDPVLLKLIPADVALRHLVVPLRRAGRTLTVAMADPGDTAAMDDLKFITRFEIEPVIAGEFALRSVVQREYDVADERVREILRQLEKDGEIELLGEEEEDPGALALQAQVEEAPVVRLINGILNDAVARGASDIHFECYEREVRVRYRIDGVLQEIMRPPPKLRAALISRFKILSDLNIAERRLPQDGRIKLRISGRVIDFRVSTLPTLFGERIVLRILDREGLTLDLDAFGMEPRARADFEDGILSPFGMVLVTGPTGSGKTTTLYSALSRLNTPGVNIMTAEDPVEFNLPGINQIQVRAEIGLTFAAALRAPPAGPERDHGWRDPRHRDRVDRRARRADGSPRSLHPAFERRPLDDHPADRHGDGAVQRGVGGQRDHRAAAGAAGMREVRGAGRDRAGSAGLRAHPRRTAGRATTPRPRLRRVRGNRLPRPARALRSDADVARAAPNGARRRAGGSDPGTGDRRRNAHAADGRSAEDRPRDDDTGRSAPGERRVTDGRGDLAEHAETAEDAEGLRREHPRRRVLHETRSGDSF
jgi:hypothetical protein